MISGGEWVEEWDGELAATDNHEAPEFAFNLQARGLPPRRRGGLARSTEGPRSFFGAAFQRSARGIFTKSARRREVPYEIFAKDYSSQARGP